MNMDNTKVGDKVIVRQHLSPSSVATVCRLTKTQVVVKTDNLIGQANERRFWKKDGRAVESSHSWPRPYIETGTPERLADIAEKQKRRELIESIKGRDLTKLRTYTLERIRSWMDAGDNYIEPR